MTHYLAPTHPTGGWRVSTISYIEPPTYSTYRTMTMKGGWGELLAWTIYVYITSKVMWVPNTRRYPNLWPF